MFGIEFKWKMVKERPVRRDIISSKGAAADIFAKLYK